MKVLMAIYCLGTYCVKMYSAWYHAIATGLGFIFLFPQVSPAAALIQAIQA